MPTPWAQKRAQIAAALAGGNPPSVGAGPMANPMIAAMSPQAPGLMGAAPTQGAMMAYANQQLQGAPGFNYVPPAVGPPPVPVAAGPGSVPIDPNERYRLARQARLLGGSSSDRGGYSTSGRGGSGSSSSARGGGFGF